MALAQSPLGEKVKLCTKDSMFILVTKFTKEVCFEFVLRSCRHGQGHWGGGEYKIICIVLLEQKGPDNHT